MTQVNKNGKQVIILARIVFKSDNRKVCYISRSSQSDGQYTTCLFAGRVCSCTCKGYQHNHKCYHATQIQQKEAERQQFQAEATAIAEERKAEAKLTAFKDGMEEQYASDPRPTQASQRQNPSTLATNLVIESKRRQEAPLQRQEGFRLMR